MVYEANYVACNAKEAAWRLDCERIKAQNKAFCEAEKEFEEVTCRTFRETLRAIQPGDGSMAGINGRAKFKGTIELELSGIAIKKDFSGLLATVGLVADLDIDGSLQWTPKGVGGTLAGCMAKWKEGFDVTVKANETLNIDVSLSPSAEHANTLVARMPEQQMLLKMTPAPVQAVFLEHPHLIANCPLLFSVGTVADRVVDWVSDDYHGAFVKGVMSVEIEQTSALLSFEMASPTASGDSWSVSTKWSEDALIFSVFK